jgi:hypothetical protein
MKTQKGLSSHGLKNCSVIHGTHKTNVLVNAFYRLIQSLDLAEFGERKTEAVGVIETGLIELLLDYQDNSEINIWDTEEMSYFLNDVLFETMDSFSPDGFYFGSHFGDGSDFGYWEIIEE